MKKIFTVFLLISMLAVSAKAVSVSDVAGVFQGSLNIGGQSYPNKEVYILPGSGNTSVTMIVPSVAFSNNCADLVLVNMVLNSNGTLSAGSAAAYIESISASSLTAASMSFTMSLTTPSHPVAVSMTFNGEKVSKNYAITNGGFEGSWSNNEVTGWHSFGTATGSFAGFVNGNTDQFSKSTDVRPGTSGSQSALIKSKGVIGGNKANGNCTNGQINAGSMSAGDASGNYNFSAPNNTGYNTAFVGQPDSLVFWAKYIPGGGSVSDNSNKARANAVITKDARYQDPETGSYGSVKVANAAINYSATSTKGWQRLSTPFVYTSLDPKTAAYILVTFSTNATPGGGNSSSSSPDYVYLDDVEIIYNCALSSLKMNGTAVHFTNGAASTDAEFSDSDYTFAATTNGKGAKTFVGYDAEHNQVQVYVVANNYSQAKAYSVYTLQMAEPVPETKDTEYHYAASTCANEPYSDELFANLSEAGTYTTTIPNTQGGDSIITLTLTTLPAYSLADTLRLNTVDTIWHGIHIAGLPAQAEPYVYRDSLKTLAGCDSVCSLVLFISDIPITYGAYEAVLCEGEQVTYEGVTYSAAFKGDILLAGQNIYGGDSIVRLTVTVYPNIEKDEYLTMQEGESRTWQGWNLSSMPVGEHTLYTTYSSVYDCDSTIVLHLTVNAVIEGLEDADAEISSGRAARKVLVNGKIYIIRKDEKMYDILGKKIQ